MPVKKGGSGRSTRSSSLSRSFLANIRSPSPPMSRTASVSGNNNINTDIVNGYQFLRQTNLNSYRVSNNPTPYPGTRRQFEIRNNRPVRVITYPPSNQSINRIVDHTFFQQIPNQNGPASRRGCRSLPTPRGKRTQ
jgi:hypothetical protein